MPALSTTPLAFFSTPGPSEMLLLAVIALLVFGKDLPNVARQWGKAFQEFRRHLHGIRSELNDAIYAEPDRPKLQYHPEFHGGAAKQHAPVASTTDAPTAASADDSAPSD